MKQKGLAQNYSVREWISLNLLGWFLGLALGPLMFLIILPRSTLDFPLILIGTLQPFFSSFLFGVGLGSMQQFVLRHWNVPAGLWMLATAFGIAIPATLLSWLIDSSLLGYDDRWALVVSVAQLLLMGFGIGGLQAILIRKTVSKVIFWVWGYVIGFFILGIVAFVIAVVAFILAEPIEKYFYSQGLWQVVEYRYELLSLSIGIVLPLVAVFLISLPTGKILQRADTVQITIKDRNDGHPEAKVASS